MAKITEQVVLIEIGDQLGTNLAMLDELICKVYPDIETILKKITRGCVREL